MKTKSPTVCTLKFESFTSRNLIEVLKETSELVTFTHEDTVQTGSNTNTDYRYTGSDPNNYVKFNDELWRIIGVFNTDDGTGNYEERVKLIRNEFIETSDPYWHNDVSNTNRNLNDWSNASLQKYLNGDYYNSLTSAAKNQITNAKWYLGGSSSYIITNEDSYNYERSNTVYSGRNNFWLGNIGLMYLSDYGFATSDDCLKIKFDNYSKDKCGANNWLFDDYQWTMTPCSRSANDVYYIVGSTSQPYYSDITGVCRSKPVLYLKSNIKTTTGDGSKDNPYELLSE